MQLFERQDPQKRTPTPCRGGFVASARRGGPEADAAVAATRCCGLEPWKGLDCFFFGGMDRWYHGLW